MILSSALLEKFKITVGAEDVLSSETDLQLYSYDSGLDRARPSAIVFPKTAGQIQALVRDCIKHKIPYVARGAGTNLCGGAIALKEAVVIAPTRMTKILSVDPQKRIAVVQPGLPNLFLKKALEPYGLHYAPDPSSQKACTIGGNIGTNAGGPHCLKYGVTSQHVLGLEVVLPDGELVRVSVNDAGVDLTGLLVGSEGTLGIVTEATLNLVPIPKHVETMLVSFPSLDAAMRTVTEIISQGILPATLEAIDQVTVRAIEGFIHAGYPTDAGAVLLIEVDGENPVLDEVREIEKICVRNDSMEFRLARNAAEREKLWEGRRGSYPSLARLAPNVLVEDGVVPRNKLAEAYRRIRAISDERGLNLSFICHAGDGNLHPQILFDERDPEQTRKVKEAGQAMLKICVDLGGSISGEHGIGIDKREAMRWLFDPGTLQQFRKIKKIFDPQNLANPDKIIPVLETELTGDAALIKQKPGNQILDHDLENFTLTVESGIGMDELKNILANKNQKVLLGGTGTLGEVLNENLPQEPRIRDQVLSMEVAFADGTLGKFGGKVVKNVAGYDMAKLFLGSRGSLGVIRSVTLKTFPLKYPVTVKKLSIEPAVPSEGARKLTEKIKKGLDPACVFP